MAAFNAGFLMNNANGGYYTGGKTILPLRRGAASFVIYRNGSANIAAWGRDASLTPGVVAVRQNLDLLVDQGKPVTGLNPNDTTQWGFTLGNAVYVWRSGVGITADGALVYAGGPGLNITTLADILARAGAVRAMELDVGRRSGGARDLQTRTARQPRRPRRTGQPAAQHLRPAGPVLRVVVVTPDFFTMSARTRHPSAGNGQPDNHPHPSAGGVQVAWFSALWSCEARSSRRARCRIRPRAAPRCGCRHHPSAAIGKLRPGEPGSLSCLAVRQRPRPDGRRPVDLAAPAGDRPGRRLAPGMIAAPPSGPRRAGGGRCRR